MGRTTEKERIQRRRRLKDLIAEHPMWTDKQYADRLDVTRQTIGNDIEHIREMEYEDKDILPYLLKLRERMEKLHDIYERIAQEERNSPNERVGAANGQVRLLKQEVKVLQGLGVLPEELNSFASELDEDSSLEAALDEVAEEETPDLAKFNEDNTEEVKQDAT